MYWLTAITRRLAFPEQYDRPGGLFVRLMGVPLLKFRRRPLRGVWHLGDYASRRRPEHLRLSVRGQTSTLENVSILYGLTKNNVVVFGPSFALSGMSCLNILVSSLSVIYGVGVTERMCTVSPLVSVRLPLDLSGKLA